MLCFCFCKKQETPQQEEISDCLEIKFEEFKQDPWSESIIKINRPDGPLYWLVDKFADGVEEIVDQDCNVVCIADCECVGGTIVFCDQTHFDFPQETIWEQ